MSKVVTIEKRDFIAIITIDNPPINAVSLAVRQGLIEACQRADDDRDIKAIILYCAGGTFIAGADIKEFDKPMEDPHLIEVINTLEQTGKLTLVALHGAALGGGVETALGCDYRCAGPTAKLGLPEVTLGLIPGANGTQRLPRLIGVAAALEMITNGKLVDAQQAKEMGLVDEIIEGDLLQGVIAYARRLVNDSAPKRRVSEMSIGNNSYPKDIFEQYRTKPGKRMRNQNAPQAAVDAIEVAAKESFKNGVEFEKEVSDKCVASIESAAMRHLFFASREVAKIPNIPKNIGTREIKKMAMIGAGTMGGGITMNFANVGIPVTLLDITQEALDKGLAGIRKNYEISQKHGRLTGEQVAQRMELFETSLDYDAINDADLVIEAVFEDMELKKNIFKRLDEVCKPGAILASNTSTLDINRIAESTSRPEDIIGLHFFSPANVMRLLEIVRCDKTSDEVIATAMVLAKNIRKVGVLSGVCFGFIGNRMMESYGREANMLLLEGATPQQVDKALYDFGMAMGPFAMYDMAGNDVGYKIHMAQPELFPDDDRYYRISHMAAEMGRLGQKTGAGVYQYKAQSREPVEDIDFQKLIESESKRLGITRCTISDEQIIQRCIYPMINEAARILQEGIAIRPGDIDVVWTNGYGFPVYRGGPLFYADTVGVSKVYDTICRFGDELGDDYGYWTPAPLLEDLAKSDKAFADIKSIDLPTDFANDP
ncbi:MAG: 3-hydroxyacyl-CoA dehydrogenase NAD-binding domain-containing protein [Gammaproteobacteria bacterium]